MVDLFIPEYDTSHSVSSSFCGKLLLSGLDKKKWSVVLKIRLILVI